jgi:F420-non-reducing hydrogenase small subunit
LKRKVAIISLTSCSGCISSLISLDIFPQFLERTKVDYFQFISDAKDIEDCDICLVEGCISEENQIVMLRKIRTQAKKVYALGTCACFGGILSLSDVKTTKPISSFIEIDGMIPGCPPPIKLFGNCLIRLVENKELELSEKNMCGTCPLRGNMKINSNIKISKLTPNPDEIKIEEENTKCFLENGILCLGPITRDGCEHKCIKMGLPCEGCMGPVSKDYTSNVINYLSLINLSKEIKDYAGIFYRFSKPKLEG